MMLELTPDEMIVFNALLASGLCDFAVIAQMFDAYGITTRVVKNSFVVEAIKGCIAS
jgi:hypothetical protein